MKTWGALQKGAKVAKGLLLMLLLLAMPAGAGAQVITNVFTGSAANDGTGTPLRGAFNRINTNFWLLTNTYPAAWTNAALKAAQDATNGLNTALVVKLTGTTNHVQLATNDLAAAIEVKLTGATNHVQLATNNLNTALVARIVDSTNSYKVREIAATGNVGFASTNTATGMVTINPWAQTNVQALNVTNAALLQSSLSVGSASGGTGTTLTMTNRAQASTRESLITARVSDVPNNGFFVYNGTGTDNQFVPAFGGLNTNTTQGSLQFFGFVTPTRDVLGGQAVLLFASGTSTSEADPPNGTLAALANRNLVAFYNFNVCAGVIAANGTLAWNTNANFSGEVAITNGTAGSALMMTTNATGPGNTTTIRSWVKIRDAAGKVLYLPAYE